MLCHTTGRFQVSNKTLPLQDGSTWNDFFSPGKRHYDIEFNTCEFKEETILPSLGVYFFIRCTFKSGSRTVVTSACNNIWFSQCTIENGTIICGLGSFSDLSFNETTVGPDAMFDTCAQNVYIQRDMPLDLLHWLPKTRMLELYDRPDDKLGCKLVPGCLPLNQAVQYTVDWYCWEIQENLDILIQAMYQNPQLSAHPSEDGLMLTEISVLNEYRWRMIDAAIVVLLSIKVHPRLGKKSALQKLPLELIRACYKFCKS